MVKHFGFVKLFFSVVILYGLKIEGRRLMGKPAELSCGSDSGLSMNCMEDGECKQSGYIKCVKGYCCKIFAEDVAPSDPPPPQILRPITMLLSSHPTTTPRQLGDNEADQLGEEWYNEESEIDAAFGGIPKEYRLENPQEKQDEKSTVSGVVKDDNELPKNNNNLNTQIMTLDNDVPRVYDPHFNFQENLDVDQLERPLDYNQDDQFAGSNGADGPYESIEDGTGRSSGAGGSGKEGWLQDDPRKKSTDKRYSPWKATPMNNQWLKVEAPYKATPEQVQPYQWVFENPGH